MALGEMYAKDESYSQAEEIFRQVIQIEEKPKEAYLELGKALRKLDEYKPALDAFLKAAVQDPADAEPLFQAGLLYLEIQKPAEAMIQFQRVLRINPRYPLVHYWLGKAALAKGDFNGALNQSQEERKINPNLADAYLLAAEAYTRLNQYTLCAQEYQKAIKLRPQGANIYVDLARCYRLAGNLDVAEAMLNHASTQESGFAPIYREQGEVYERRGDYERAIEAYNQYFVLSPNAPDREQIEGRIQNMGRR
jgi:tetratricopeptide (TPR) repeat protein